MSKNGDLSNFFLLGNIRREKVFYDILEGKTPFEAIKTRSSKSRKIGIFPKGLAHRFGLNIVIFTTSFKGNIGQENFFYDILEQKNAVFIPSKGVFRL